MNRAVALGISLGGFVALLAAVLLWAIPHIEDDLTNRAASALDGEQLGEATVVFDGRDGTVEGRGALAAGEALQDLRGARSVDVGEMLADAAPASTTTAVAPRPAPSTTTTTSATTAAEAPAEPVELDVVRVGQEIVLSGRVGTEDDRQRLRRGATASGFDVDDQLVVDDTVDASGRSIEATDGLLMALFVGSDDATLTLRGTDATVVATAKDPVEAASIEEALETSRRRGLAIDASVDVVDLSEDQQVVALQSEIDQIFELSRIISGETPGFGYSSDDLNTSARNILDRVTVAMRRYPKPVAEVIGHTDSDGSAIFNQQLSEERSKTVVDYLVDAGVAADRLTPSGRGESEPVADNSTEIGRLENRRVTFSVGKRAS